jgi:hypothetical protein
VRWPRTARRGGETPAIDLDELLWLDVRPGAVVMQAKWKCKPIGGPVEQIRLTADPRLAMLPLRKGSLVASAHRSDRQPDVLVLQLARPIREEAVAEAQFLLQGTYGLGNVRLPRLEAIGANVNRRLLAVSIDPAFDYDPRLEGEIAPAAVADFLGHWGADAPAQPALAYQLSHGDVGWSLATRRRQSRLRVDQSTTLAFLLESVELRYEATLSSELESGYQYPFQFSHLPSESLPEVRGVSIVEDGQELASHWAWANPATLVVHLKKRATGSHRASLVLRANTAAAGVLQLPIVQVEGARTATSRYRIVRRDAVLVQMRSSSDVAVEQGPAVAATSDAARGDDAPLAPQRRTAGPVEQVIRELLVTGPSPEARFAFRPNRPRVEATLATVLEPAATSTWNARIDVRVGVRDGLVDELRLDVPDSWSGPVDVQPAATWRTLGTGATGGRQLLIRPLAPIQREQKFVIRGSWSPAPDTSVPIVGLRGATTLRRFVVLPNESLGRRFHWETRSLSRSSRDEIEARRTPSGIAREVLEATSDNALATLRAITPAAPRSGVSLAEVRVAMNSMGEYYGAAAFTLRAAGRRHCDIELPDPLTLIHVRGSHGRSLAFRTGERTWRLPLASEADERVEVLFQGVLQTAANARPRIVAPRISEVATDQTRWRIYGPPELDVSQIHGSSAPSDSQAAHESAPAMPPPLVENVEHFAASLAPSRTVNVAAEWNEIDVLGTPARWSITPDRLVATVLWIVTFGLLAALMRLPEFCQWVAGHPRSLWALIGIVWWLLLVPSAIGLFVALLASAAPLAPVWRIKRAKRPQLVRLPAQLSHKPAS